MGGRSDGHITSPLTAADPLNATLEVVQRRAAREFRAAINGASDESLLNYIAANSIVLPQGGAQPHANAIAVAAEPQAEGQPQADSEEQPDGQWWSRPRWWGSQWWGRSGDGSVWGETASWHGDAVDRDSTTEYGGSASSDQLQAASEMAIPTWAATVEPLVTYTLVPEPPIKAPPQPKPKVPPTPLIVKQPPPVYMQT